MSLGKIDGGQTREVIIGLNRTKTGSFEARKVTSSPVGKAAESSSKVERTFGHKVDSDEDSQSSPSLSPRTYTQSELDEMDTEELPGLADPEVIDIGGFKNEFEEQGHPAENVKTKESDRTLETEAKSSPKAIRKVRDVGAKLLAGVRGLVSDVGTKLKQAAPLSSRKPIVLEQEKMRQPDLKGDAAKAIKLARDEITKTAGGGKPLRGTSEARAALVDLNRNLLKPQFKEPLEQLFKKLPNDRPYDLSRQDDQQLLKEFFSETAKILNSNSDNMRIFKEVCGAIKESVQENGIDSNEALGIAADQLFLQILNPALAAPQTLGLAPHGNDQVKKNAIAFSSVAKLVVQGTPIRATDVTSSEAAKIEKQNTFLAENRKAILDPVMDALFAETPSLKTMVQEQKDWSPRALFENRQLFEALKEWSKAKHMDENILYIGDACQALQEPDPQKFKVQLADIYSKYMAPDSEKEININGRYKKAISDLLESNPFDLAALEKAKQILTDIMTMSNKDGLNRESMLTRDLFGAFKQEKG